MNAPASDPQPPDHFSREEFENFLHLFTHEIRNRLNGIALEATDLAEQAGPDADAARLQQQIQECSAFLKAVREMLASPDFEGGKMTLVDFMKKLRERIPLK